MKGRIGDVAERPPPEVGDFLLAGQLPLEHEALGALPGAEQATKIQRCSGSRDKAMSQVDPLAAVVGYGFIV